MLNDTLINGDSSKLKTLIQTDPKLDLELALVLSDAKTFLEQFTAMHWLSGALTVNGKLRGAGTSQSTMIGALNGHLELHSSEAAFKGVDLAAIAEQALVAPLVNWQGSKTDPVSFDASFELSDGVAALQDNNLSAPGLKMVTSGEIDMLRQALALTALVNLNRSNDKPLRIAVKGPWSKPQPARAGANRARVHAGSSRR